MTTFPLEKISATSEEFLLQSYPQFLRRFCRRPFVVAMFFVCFAALTTIISTSIFGGLASGAKVNFTQDWGFITVSLFGFVAVYYYLRMPAHFSGTLTKLRDNGVFDSDEIEIGKRVGTLAQDSRIRALPIFVAVVVEVMMFAMSTLRTHNAGYWFDINRVNSAIMLFNTSIIWLALAGVMVSMAISGAALNSILASNNIIVHSLHPDKSGGFGPVGDFSFGLTVMALFPGIMVGGFVWGSIKADTFRYDYPGLLLAGLA
jgi:hypothetical protein